MFLHKMKYTFKFLFRSKNLLFWTFIFPIILGTCFYFAFKDIESSEKLKVMDIAVVQTEEFKSNQVLQETLNYLSKEDDNQIFNITYVKDNNKADKLLENEKIIGYLEVRDEPKILINSNGINETIFKYIVDEAITNSYVIKDYIESGILYDELNKKIEELTSNKEYTKDVSRSNLSYTMIEYYTLIAMAALYSGMISIYVINNEMANISSKGKRNSVAPIKKSTSILGSLTASYIVGLIGLTLLFLYTIYGLKVDYGNNLLRVIILGVVGVLAGESLGVAVGSVFKTNEGAKTGILIAIVMTGSFLSGMMGIVMKYMIDTNIPILNYINPAAMITDGLYSLYYDVGFSRYYFDLISLLIFSLILICVSIVKIRRVRYDSI